MAETKTDKDAAVAFRPPATVRNQIVVWYPHGRKELTPGIAVVQARGQRTLDLAVLRPTDRFFTQLMAVQHVDDPSELDPERRAQDGGWDLAPPEIFGPLAQKLVERMERIERRLGQVISRMPQGEKKES